MTEPTGQSEIDVGALVAGTYQVTGLIGRGGMGQVWVAQHVRLAGKRVAVKVLLSTNAGDEAYQRFRREADIASRLGHPNIIEVIDFNHTPSGTPYLILEYLVGENLGARIARGPVPLDTTLNVARQIGSALAAAHRAGVVHRDLKPDNIYLCPTDMGGVVGDMVKVLDFGISKIRSSNTLQTQEARILGTPQYMSPEQASGKNSSIDERTDVFALGAIIYEMLCGRPAFSGDNLAMVVYQVVFAEPTPLEQLMGGLPPNVIDAVKRAMAKDPAHRFPDVASFMSDLTGRPLHTIDRLSAQAPQPTGSGLAYAPTGASNPGLASTAMAPSTAPPYPVGSNPAALPAGTMPGQAATGTQPSGTAPAPAVVAKKKSHAWIWAVVALFVVGGGAAGAALALRGKGDKPAVVANDPTASGGGTPVPKADKPAPNADKPVPNADKPAVVTVTPDAAAPVAAATPDAAPVASAAPDAAPAVVQAEPDPDKPVAVKPDKPDPVKPDKPDPVKPVKPDKPDSDPDEDPANAGPLREANAALASGDFRTAVRAGQRALADLPAGRKGPAYATITMGHCGQKDLSNARAMFQNVPRRGRNRVATFCARHGVELR